MKRLLYLFVLSLAANSPARDIFAPAPQARIQLAPPAVRREVARARAVAPMLEFILELRANRTNDLRLNLFDDTSFGLIVKTREDRPGGGCSISGQLLEDPTGTFDLVLHRGVLVGVIRLPARGQLFRVNYAPGGSHIITEVIEANLGECHAQAPPGAPAQPAAPAGDAIQCGGDPANDIIVMIAYTAITRIASGNTASMQAECQLAVDTANQCYGRSQINTRLRLVHTEEVNYDEVGTFQNHLDRLTSRTDGIMDNLHTARNDYGADVVSLFVEDSDAESPTPLCGLAHLMTTLSSGFEDHAFSIVNRGCASANFSFAHEVGHNMGCDHDRQNASGARLYSYSYGWRFTGSDSVQYRTVMAYAPGNRVGYFSNPNISFMGTPTGVAVGQATEAFNALTINSSASTVANWRRSTVWVDFSYAGSTQNGCFSFPYNILASGIAAVPIGGTIEIKASSRNEPITVTKAMSLQAYGGPVTIGRN